MRLNAIIALLLLALAIAGATIWWVTRPLPPTNTPEQPRETLTIEKLVVLLKGMDASGDGIISEKEFAASYGGTDSDDPKAFVIHRGPGQPPLTAREAYDLFDQNRSGQLDPEDLYMIQSFKGLADLYRDAALGLTRRAYFGKTVGLNSDALKWSEAEVAAARNGTLPFQGQFFASRYFKAWHVVALKDGKREEGFALVGDGSETMWTENALRDGDVKLLQAGAKLKFIPKADLASVEALPGHAYTRYARRINEVKPDDLDGNLAFARDLTKDGLKEEAKMMYKRVLILDRAHAEALDALGLKIKAGSVEYERK